DIEEIASFVLGSKLSDVPTGRRLPDLEIDRLHVGRDGGTSKTQEVEVLIILADGGNHDFDFAVLHFGGHGELSAVADRSHRPAHHLAEKFVVAGPVGPARG